MFYVTIDLESLELFVRLVRYQTLHEECWPFKLCHAPEKLEVLIDLVVL